MLPEIVKTFKASGAIAARRIVKAGASDGLAAQAAAATDALIGVCVQPGGAADTERCDVVMSGIADVDAGGTIAFGDLVTADSAGKAVSATRHTHTENTAVGYTQNATTGAGTAGRVIGIALAAAASGDIVEVMLAPAFS